MFLHFTQNLKMATKNGGKMTFFTEAGRRLCINPGAKKYCQNRSISHRFQNKCPFAFYTEIQDDRLFWQENDFWQKLPHKCWPKFH